MPSTTLLGIAGSLRSGSLNGKLLRAASELLPEGTTLEIASIRDIPFYDGDVEAASGAPTSVRSLKDRLAAADGLVLVTPEYNNSVPGVLKNAIDWLSRPASDIPTVFGDLPVALMGATPGRGATALSQAAWLPILRTLGTAPWFGPRIGVAQANAAFDVNDRLIDDTLRTQLERFMAGFVEFTGRSKRKARG